MTELAIHYYLNPATLKKHSRMSVLKSSTTLAGLLEVAIYSNALASRLSDRQNNAEQLMRHFDPAQHFR